MRRLLFSTTILLGCLFLGQTLSAQESVRDRIARKQAQEKRQAAPELTIRAANMNDSQTQDIGNAPWMREIYRFVDLNKDKNAPLYYPVQPIGERMNLFTMIFQLLANNSIPAYEYLLDGRELFTEKYRLNFKGLLESYGIMYTMEGNNYIVDEGDVPSNEVLGYYIKEAWYFNKTNSVVDTKTLAICPVIFRQDDYATDSERFPLFWVLYEDIKPYAALMPIMISNLNNASTRTIDDFFIQRSFDGEIDKVTNMKNLTLQQEYKTDSLVKQQRAKIEAELKQFNDDLWVLNDSISTNVASKAKNSKAKNNSSNNSSSTEDQYEQKVRTNEVKQTKSAPVRSMRSLRGRR